MIKDCDGALAQDVTRRSQERLVGTHFRVMVFFTALTEAIASRQSLFVAGLDPTRKCCATGPAAAICLAVRC